MKVLTIINERTLPNPSSHQCLCTPKQESSNQAIGFGDIIKLQEEYYHHSAVDQEDIDTRYDGHTKFIKDVWRNDSPDGGDGNNTRYVGDGKNRKAKREVYPNSSSKAIVPLAM